MALTATIHHVTLTLSDVDRGVYETLDLRIARHPSETLRYLLTRLVAYALAYEEGIAFSKGGISSTDEPPLSVRDRTGVLQAWIDVGSPAPDRVHKARKAAERVAIYTHTEPTQLRKAALAGEIHRAESIDVWVIEQRFLDELEPRIERNVKMELVRTDGQLYATIGNSTFQGTLVHSTLGSVEP